MNIKIIPLSVCLTTGALLSFSISAHAVTYSTGGRTLTNQGLESNQTGVTRIDFNTVPTNGTGSYTSGIATYTTQQTPTNTQPDPNGLLIRNSTQTAGVTTNNPTGGYAPANDTSNYLITGGYYDQRNTSYSPTGNTASGIPTYRGPVNINFSRPVGYFGLYWGLINSTNEITFYNSSGTALPIRSTTNVSRGNSITGNELDVSGVADGASGPSEYVNFDVDSGESISRITLANSGRNIGNTGGASTSTAPGNGFESDNHAFREVPFGFSPGLGILLLGAWGAIAQLKSKVKQWKSFKRGVLH